MIGRKSPRWLLLTVALGVAVTGILLSVFYGQYRWLANQVVTTSSTEYRQLAEADFERLAHTEMRAATEIMHKVAVGDQLADITRALNTILIEHHSLTGTRFVDLSGNVYKAGSIPQPSSDAATIWLKQRLLIASPVVVDGVELGLLAGAFDLADLHAELARFETALGDKQTESRQVGYIWIGAGTLSVLLFCGGVFWLSARSQNKRIGQLKIQAEKLRDSDFGEPLLVSRHDELGDLASVFNDLRHRLRKTTHSRDYINSILSGMNEAIIVTSDDGMVTQINTATSHLLGYQEDELLNIGIDYIVNTNKGPSLANDSPSGLPKEAIFESKFGESIPVSYTCSIIEASDGVSARRIYAAQNITERRRAEKRIRYLARIDPLTKIPNRMQFQHLLQRGIARARRSGKPLCLFYVDLDYFKEVNDTFGHLAGDTTLETTAERLSAVLPKNSIIGRLAGDEFAIMVDDLGPDENGIIETNELAQSLLTRLADPFFVQGHEVFMTASLGVAYYPKDAPNVIDLIRNADAALYHSKKAGGNVFSYYAPKMNEASVERLMTKSKLKRAFERDELLVHYQPKYNLKTGEVFGAEALVRWELPDRGMILPADFIPIA